MNLIFLFPTSGLASKQLRYSKEMINSQYFSTFEIKIGANIPTQWKDVTVEIGKNYKIK